MIILVLALLGCAVLICILAHAMGEICICDVLLQFALAYISAFIFWLLTVYFPERKKRASQNVLIHDLFIHLKSQIEELETAMGHDRAYVLADYKSYFLGDKKEAHCKIIHDYCNSIKKGCKDILTNNFSLNDDEINHLLFIYNACHSVVDLTNLPIVEEQVNDVYKPLESLFKEIPELDKLATKTFGAKFKH